MKKLIYWIGIVVVLVVGVDMIVSLTMRKYVSGHSLKGDYETLDYLLRETDDSILVLGSSVAQNSFNTARISDSLNMTAYNGGANGQTFPFYLTLLKEITRQHHINTVILAITAPNLVDSGIGSRYNLLAPYYGMGYSAVDSGMESKSKIEKILLKSNLYRYNTIWWRILLYNFVSSGTRHEAGYVSKGIPAYFPKREKIPEDNLITEERAAQLSEFAGICRQHGVRLIVVLTPRYQEVPETTKIMETLKRGKKNGDFQL